MIRTKCWATIMGYGIHSRGIHKKKLYEGSHKGKYNNFTQGISCVTSEKNPRPPFIFTILKEMETAEDDVANKK